MLQSESIQLPKAFQSVFLKNYQCSRFLNYAADNVDTKSCKMTTFFAKTIATLLATDVGLFNSFVEILSQEFVKFCLTKKFLYSVLKKLYFKITDFILQCYFAYLLIFIKTLGLWV